MNRLHQIIELMDGGTLLIDPHLHAPLGPIGATIRSALTSAQCFWLGDADLLDRVKAVPEISRAPFPFTWLEAISTAPDGQRIDYGLLVTSGNLLTSIVCFARATGSDWSMQWVAPSVDLASGDLTLSTDHPAALDWAGAVVGLIAKAFSAINCINVERINHQPETKLQQSRLKRSRTPLFSYWTLHLSPANGRSAEAGGRHASPRVHLRRGHPRQFAPGKWTWVQAHAVGDRAAGIVHKDYSLQRAAAKGATS